MNSESRYVHMDAIRAFGMLLVLFAHAGLGEIVPGGSGLTMFFSLSGFIITYLMLREKDQTGGFKVHDFYLRRALKILPPLIVVVIIPTFILALVRPINWSPFIAIVFFYYNWLYGAGVQAPLPGSSVTWSLSIEEQFYLVFAVIWLVTIMSGVRTRWLALVTALAAVGSLVDRIFLASSSTSHTQRIYCGSDTRMDAIALGILTAIAFHHSLRRGGIIRSLVQLSARDSALIAAVLLYMASLLIRDTFFRDTFRYSIQALVTCIVILYGFGTQRSPLRVAFNAVCRVKIVQFIGLASYSIYVVHLTAMYYSEHFTTELPRAIKILVLVAIGTCAGFVVYLAIERPIVRLRNKYRPWQQATAPSSDGASPEPPEPPEPNPQGVAGKASQVP